MSREHHIAFDDIKNSLESKGDQTAIVDKQGVHVTYNELRAMITGTRSKLRSMGIKKGTKVLVFITMSVELYATLEALFSLGAVSIFVDPWMKGKKMNAIISKVSPEFILVNKKAARYVWMLPSTWSIRRWSIKKLPQNDETWEIEKVSDNDTALITFTTGSSGLPKGAKRTFAFIHAQAEAIKPKLVGSGEQTNIDLTNLPIVALAGLAVGNTVVIPNVNLMKIDKADSMQLISDVRKHGITRAVLSPPLLIRLLEGMQDQGAGSIEHIVTGGSPLFGKYVRQCIEDFPDIFFESIYGSTEVEPISTAPLKEIYDRLDQPLKGVYVGRPDERLKVRIVTPTQNAIDADFFRSHILKDGEQGEIIVTGSFVNTSYYQDPEAFERFKVVDEHGQIWHRTGDIGYLEEGKIYLVGRGERVVEREGRQYHPFPVELFVQFKFGLEDVGYIQTKGGQCLLFVGSDQHAERSSIEKAVKDAGYPLDSVVFKKSPLPRDPRHRSKLMVDKLKE